MKKLVTPTILASLLTGCGHSPSSEINCETPEVQQTELQILQQFDPRDGIAPPLFESAKLQVESTAQFTNKQTGMISCNVQYSFLDTESGSRQVWYRTFVFDVNVADDHEHFTVALENR